MINLTKKTKFALAAAILLICGLLSCGLYLRAHAHAAYTPSGTSRAPEAERPRVTLTGSGYEVNDEQATPLKNPDHLFIKKVVKKKTTPKPKKKTTTVKKPQPKTKKSTSGKAKKTTATNKKTTAARKKPASKNQEINKNARSGKSIQITTDIPGKVKDKQKTLTFTVTAKTASGKSIPSSDIKITSPKKCKRLRSGKSDDKYSAKFSIDLEFGTNTIKIKATDKKTKTSGTLKKNVYRSGKYPYIETSIKDGMTTSKSYVDFTVEGADEKGNELDIDDGLTASVSTSDETIWYANLYFYRKNADEIRLPLKHGKNEITVIVGFDGQIKERKKTIYCNSKPIYVTLGIEAKTLSLGKLSPDKEIKTYPNERLATIVEKYSKSTGFDIKFAQDDNGSAFTTISRKNIAANAEVPEKLSNIIKNNTTYSKVKKTSHKNDSISDGDFIKNSKWHFYMNGNWADMLNLYYYGSEDAIRAYKSQKIRIAFSLTGDGKDLDGTLKW